jgi:hypothetical protein
MARPAPLGARTVREYRAGIRAPIFGRPRLVPILAACDSAAPPSDNPRGNVDASDRETKAAAGGFVGRYELTEHIATGRTCDVFLAHSHGVEGFRRTVALKRLKASLAADKRFRTRYLEQVRRQSAMSHGNVVQILDLGEFEGAYYLTEEHVEGYDLMTLREMATSGALTFTAPLGLFILSEVIKGVEYGHRHLNPNTLLPLNMAHGDLHPRNILIGFQGDVKVADFGIFRVVAEHDTKTPEGMLRTFSYISPEAARGDIPTPRSDIFTLGLIALEMCTGVHPYAGGTPEDVRANALAARFAPELLEQVPETLRRLVRTMLEPNPSDRLVELGFFYDRLMVWLQSEYEVGTRAVANFVADVGDVDLSTSFVYSGLLVSSAVPSAYSAVSAALMPNASQDVSLLWELEPRPSAVSQRRALVLPERGRPCRLYGRKTEIDEILESARACEGGSCRAVFVSGPRGIGKTRLLQDAATALDRAGQRAVLLVPGADAAARPFGLILEALSLATLGQPLAWTSDPASALEAAVAEAGLGSADDRRLLRQLVDLDIDSSHKMSSLREHVRSLFLALVAAGGASAPLAVLVDSPENADSESIALLQRLLGDPETRLLVLVVASRQRGLLNELSRATPEEQRHFIILQRLDDHSLRDIATHVAGEPPGPDFFLLAGGLPQAAVELGLGQRLGLDLELIDERVEHVAESLDETSRWLIATCLAAGDPLPVEVLADACELKRSEARAHCERLAALHLLSEGPSEHWAAGLRSVAVAILDTLPQAERDLRARRLADLQRARAGRADALAVPVRARLMASAGRARLALELGKQHATSLVRAGFLGVAIDYLEYLASLTRRGTIGRPSESVVLRLWQVQLALVGHHLERARKILGLLSSESSGSPSEIASLGALAQHARLALRTGERDAARAALSRLARDADDHAPPLVVALACLALSEWHEASGSLARARELLSRALHLLRTSSGAGGFLLAEVCTRLPRVLVRRGRRDQARALLRALDPSTSPDDDIGRLWCDGLTALYSDDFDSAAISLESAFAMAQRTGRLSLCLDMTADIVEAWIGVGDDERARTRLDEFRVLAERVGSDPLSQRVEALDRLLLARRGGGAARLQELRNELREARAASDRGRALELGWLLWRAGELDDAEPLRQLAEDLGDRARADRLGGRVPTP